MKSVVNTSIRNYAQRLVFVFVFLLGLFAGTTLLIDPYGIGVAPTLSGFNAEKTRRLEDGKRVYVGAKILEGGQSSIILGNSRVVDGFPEKVEAEWPGGLSNMGMRGAGAFELGRAAVLAGRDPTLRCVVLSLDFEDFSHWEKTKATYWISALPDGNLPLGIARMALSPHAFLRSVQTLWDNVFGIPEQTRWQSSYLPGQQRERFESTATGAVDFFRNFGYDPQRLTYLAQAIDLLTQKGVQVIVFTPPVHALREQALKVSGRWDEAYAIRSQIAGMVAGFEDRKPREQCVKGGGAVMFDMSGFRAGVQTPIPTKDQTVADKWYHETTHYTPKQGLAILSTLQGKGRLGEQVRPSDYLRIKTEAEQRASKWLAQSADLETKDLVAAITRSAQKPTKPYDSLRIYILRDDWRNMSREARRQNIRLTDLPNYHAQTLQVKAP